MIDTATYNNFMAANPGLTPQARDYANMAGTGPDVMAAPTQPVSVLSSNAGKNIVSQNTSSLQKIESGYMGPSIVDYLNSGGKASDVQSRAELAKQYGVNYDIKATGQKSAGQNTQLLNALRNISGSSTSGVMVDSVNKSVSGGVGMTSSEQQGYNDLTKKQDEVTMAAAKAKAALEARDYKSMDYWTAKADENKQLYEKQLSDYYESTKSLRDSLSASMTPGAKEQELNKKLVDIRSQAERFKLQTEEDKFREYEGQTLGFAGGRASEIDRKASFKNQEYLLQEKNLLLNLGLEQELRKMTKEGTELQLGFLQDDYSLQTKVQERLDAKEEALFEKADKLEDDAKDSLISIINELNGVDPSKLDATSLKQLEDLSARSGLPFNLVQEALATQHAKTVFDNALKTRQENRLSKEGDGGTKGVTTGFKDTKIESNVREDAVELLGNVDAGATTLEKAYKQLRTLYSTAEASDQALKDLLGIEPPPVKTILPGTGGSDSAFGYHPTTVDNGGMLGSPIDAFKGFTSGIADSVYNFLFD